MPKLKNSNATFWVIFKHCVLGDDFRSQKFEKKFVLRKSEKIVKIEGKVTLAPSCQLWIFYFFQFSIETKRLSGVTAGGAT